jgi:exopolyphosphatase / guanosine-5'-triphosphate,3'-diphosphate pyrophosphatase
MPNSSVSRAPVAVIDIGSNSVRLVAYDRLSRAPVPMFNEKSLCGLGRDVAVTGLLPEDGLVQAREAIRRYRVLCDLMKVERLYILATAAARRATNGPAFIAEVEQILGEKVSMLPGTEEARLAALGVVAGLHRPNGLVGDLGGGSLELIDIEDGALGEGVSLELGGLALRDSSGRNLKKAATLTNNAFKTISTLGKTEGRDLFAIGGTWRAIARLHMAHTGYSLNVLHGYAVPAEEIAAFCRLLRRVDVDTLPAINEIARERRPLLVYGALVLELLISRSKVSRFVVSTSGVREGVLYSQLPPTIRAMDPLISGARVLSDIHARAPDHAPELIAWMDAFAASLPQVDSEEQRRLRHAACLVSEVAWRANPDYRAEEASRVVAFAALSAVTHEERAFLASVQYARYEGLSENTVPPLRALLSPARADEARALGCLLRVAYNISAGQPGVLPQTPIRMRNGVLTLTLPLRFADLSNERLTGRLKQAAKMLGCGYVVEVEQPQPEMAES